MTSEQIQNTNAGTIEWWLQEIAYQLAVMNERNTPPTLEDQIRNADLVATALRGR
jgi:hypothetical protein